MSKLHSFVALSCALLFTNAHAPTSGSWRDVPSADSFAAHKTEAYGATANAVVVGADAPTAHVRALDEIDRFRVDELNLPDLNVDIPELFEWSDDQESYFVDATTFAESPAADLIDARPVHPFRTAMAVQSGGHHGSAPGGLNRSHASMSNAHSDSADGYDHSAVKGSGDDAPSETIASLEDGTEEPLFTAPIDEGSTAPTNLLMDIGQDDGSDRSKRQAYDDSPVPVPVPLPGSLWLVALGLAGLQVTSRRKT